MRRVVGLILMPAGLALMLASGCAYWLALADYFGITELWGMTCPDAIRTKALLIGGLMIAVLGQRLYSGRDLKTGKKPDAEE
ncbi:hypothetical protein [Rhizomicrobium electricum]|jgi:hypothetical protein|uniref:Lipoprotein n=1 Tax=Rhizomicrobium electricum TaxID=480070 RepID=A0ABP3PD33_9PROT|nr:hypothetical protein [Rhizomicrobium electricum]NIJ48635.1 hypothetical protein [Rhizomicrobium electricum]